MDNNKAKKWRTIKTKERQGKTMKVKKCNMRRLSKMFINSSNKKKLNYRLRPFSCKRPLRKKRQIFNNKKSP